MKLASPENPSYKWLVFATIATGTFISVVDIGNVSLALPSIGRHFNTELGTLKWVTVGYSLLISMLLLPLGRLGDLIGRKRLYVAGLFIFLVAVTVAGLSQSIAMLIVTRSLQGIGAAMIQANGMATVVSAFPESERGKALGFHLSVVGAGAITGPALGGLLVDSFGWRSVFYADIPLAILGIAAAAVVLQGARPGTRQATPPGFDWAGAALSAGLLLFFMVAVSEGGRAGWASPPIILAWTLFAVLLVAFIRQERRTRAPMLDLPIFQRRLVSFGVITGFITFMGTSSALFMMTFYVQQVLGYTPREAGLVMIAGPIAMVIWGPISGRLSDRFGWRSLNFAGQTLCASALFLLAFRLTASSSIGFVLLTLVMASSGMGLFNTPNSSSVLGAVDRSRYGVVSALMQLVRNSGQVTGVAVATTIVAATMAAHGFAANMEAVRASGNPEVREAFILGLHRVFFAMGALTALGMLLTFAKGERAPQQAGEKAPSMAASPPGTP